MNEVGFNGRFAQLQLRHQALLEESANQIEMLAHLVNVVGPNVKSRYMMLVGQFEHRVYELKMEISRWQRRFTLRQAALNRGDKPDLVAIETQLDAEFEQYIETVRKHIREIKEASSLYHAEKVSDEESTAIRIAYLDAVKKLHPDINPDLSASAKDLWNQIQNAYAAHDWENVKFLAGLVDSVVSGARTFAAGTDGMAELEAAVAKLEAKCRELREKRAALKSEPPFAYEDFLDDADDVETRRNQLFAQIEALETNINEYQGLWNNGK